MRRRECITLLGCAAGVWPIAARAQQPSRILRVGYLSPVSLTDFGRAALGAFRLKLQELGYVEGRNLILDLRRSDGDNSRLPALAAELVSLRPDVIVAIATPTTSAVRKATASIPIVMLSVADPIGNGFVKSFAKPGGNITGLVNMALDVNAKSLELFLLVVPGAKRIAVLRTPNPNHAAQVQEIDALARTLGLTILPVITDAAAGLEEAFETIETEKCDGLIVLSDLWVSRSVVDHAAKVRLPAIYQVSQYARMGGLISFSADLLDQFRRGAVYVDRILKGAAPAEMPVEQPTKFELRINLKTAKALGVTIPDSILVRADEVIE